MTVEINFAWMDHPDGSFEKSRREALIVAIARQDDIVFHYDDNKDNFENHSTDVVDYEEACELVLRPIEQAISDLEKLQQGMPYKELEEIKKKLKRVMMFLNPST